MHVALVVGRVSVLRQLGAVLRVCDTHTDHLRHRDRLRIVGLALRWLSERHIAGIVLASMILSCRGIIGLLSTRHFLLRILGRLPVHVPPILQLPNAVRRICLDDFHKVRGFHEFALRDTITAEGTMQKWLSMRYKGHAKRRDLALLLHVLGVVQEFASV